MPQRIMGYSLAGSIERVGTAVTEYRVGQRVYVAAPHAQYAVGEGRFDRRAPGAPAGGG